MLAVSLAVARADAEDAVSGYLFGNVNKPLLVSVRSGSKFSMPSMMDTVLNDTTKKEMPQIYQ